METNSVKLSIIDRGRGSISFFGNISLEVTFSTLVFDTLIYSTQILTKCIDPILINYPFYEKLFLLRF